MTATFVDPFIVAVTHHQSGRLADAERRYRGILAVIPDHVGALNNLGLMVSPDEAEALFVRALAALPDHADSYQNLGNVLQARGEFERAAANYRRGLRLRPGDANLLLNLGKVLVRLGRSGEAVTCFRQALEVRPEDPTLLYNLSVVLNALGEREEAVACCQRSLKGFPEFSAGFLHLGHVLWSLGRLDDAIEAFRQAIILEPDGFDAVFFLGIIVHVFNRFEESLRQFERSLVLRPGRVDVYDSLLMTLFYLPGGSLERSLAAHWRYDRLFSPQPVPPPPARPREPGRRLRIGYVSDELKEHFAGYFIEPLVRAHDRSEVEVFGYSGIRHPDAATGRLKGLCDHWRETLDVGDEVMAGWIRDDGIDILVDLSGHSAPNRLPVFARKPAPVQMTWLGYPATTGLAAMDYRLVDPVTDPEGVAEPAACEALVRFRDGFICFQPPAASDVRTAPFLESGRIRFGSFNNLNKTAGPVIALWAALLRRVPEATLTLKDWRLSSPDVRRRVEADFAERGVAVERLELLSWADDRAGHLEACHRLDIGLDTFPYNGTTTTCETLWMGVPVVTLLGDRHVSRVGASLLTRIGLDDLVAGDEDAYVEIAAALARDPGRLAGLRQGLRQRMLTSPLCDATGFARRIEDAYRIMWRRWCRGEPPRPFSL